MSPKKDTDTKFNGTQKASIIMMSIDEDVATKVFSLMNEDEIKEISQTMSSLGTVDQSDVDDLMDEFSEQIGHGGSIIGDLDSTQKLLTKVLGAEKVATIMEDIAGPAGRNTWDKLNNVNEELLASFLKNEYPQTAALVLTKIRTSQAAKVLGVLPDSFSMEVIQRMLTIEPVKREVLADIEKTLQTEFMTNLASTKQFDSFEVMAEVFNNFDRNTENKFMELLESNDPDSAERIKELMFTFEDLVKIEAAGIQTLLRKADKDKLAIALKGSSDEIRDLFFTNMSERAAKIMKEDMESKGPVRMRDVDEAQMSVVTTAKEMADSGEIIIPEGNEEEEEMVY